MDEIQKYIITTLMHNPGLQFNELLNKKFESNKFAYHIKKLEESNLIKRSDDKYYLSHEGKKYTVFIEGETGEKAKHPLIGIIVFAIRDDEVLLMHRKKEPFYGIWGGQGGKMKFNQYPDECAIQEFKEETGLDCDVELKGMLISKTYNNGNHAYNHQQFIYLAKNLKGNIVNSREGENHWIKLNKVKELKLFPDVPNLIKMCQKDGFTIFEADRFQENDEFNEMKIRNEMFFSK